MPIEIKELIIKMTVQDKVSEAKPTVGDISPAVKAKIVDECVEKIMKKLPIKTER